ncbi:MAG: hypothetical protein FWE56_01370 [Candidatus Bathyarchaeota archaeon]|nr:hypothetical protein [Candidatus Termiticorpusculum sp.]
MSVSCLMVFTVAPVSAQAGYKPAVPQISSIKLVDSSYDVPPTSTTTVDQYTGKETTTTAPGYHVNSLTIEVTIKNQPFTPYIDENTKDPAYGPNGKEFNLYYRVQAKGHFGENWRDFGELYVIQSNSGHTVVSSAIVGEDNIVNYAAGSQLDFRVQASVGYKYNELSGRLFVPYPGPVWVVAPAEYSDWSRVQTFTIPGSLPSQTATLPTSPITSDGNDQPQYPEQTQPPNVIFTHPFVLMGVGTLFTGVIVFIVLVFLKRHLNTSTYLDSSIQTNTNTNLSSKFFVLPQYMLDICVNY